MHRTSSMGVNGNGGQLAGLVVVHDTGQPVLEVERFVGYAGLDDVAAVPYCAVRFAQQTGDVGAVEAQSCQYEVLQVAVGEGGETLL